MTPVEEWISFYRRHKSGVAALRASAPGILEAGRARVGWLRHPAERPRAVGRTICVGAKSRRSLLNGFGVRNLLASPSIGRLGERTVGIFASGVRRLSARSPRAISHVGDSTWRLAREVLPCSVWPGSPGFGDEGGSKE